MSSQPETAFRFRFSLKTLLVVLVAVGVGTGVLGRLFFQNPNLFGRVLTVLSTLVPYLLAIGTILWIGFRSRRNGLVAWGGVLFLVPILGMGLLWLAQRYAGPAPGGLGVVSTQQLIQQRLPKQINEPWVWNELERRLQAGTLSQKQVDNALRKLILHMTGTRPNGWDQPLSWQDDFLKSASQAGLITDQTLLALCDAFYGPKPTVQLPRVRENSPGFDLEIKYGSTWGGHSGLGLELLWEIDRILLDGKPLNVEQNYKHGERWSGRHNGSLEAGDHELTVELRCAYVDRDKLIGLNANDLPSRGWPQARKRWKPSVSVPLKVYAADVEIVSLVTDPGRAPRGEVRVNRLVAQVDRDDKKKIILNLEFANGLSIPLSCDVAMTMNGDLIELGHAWVVDSENGRARGGSGLEARLDALDPSIQHADIILTPNPSHIEQNAAVSEMWGQRMILRSVPIERLDLEAAQASEQP